MSDGVGIIKIEVDVGLDLEKNGRLCISAYQGDGLHSVAERKIDLTEFLVQQVDYYLAGSPRRFCRKKDKRELEVLFNGLERSVARALKAARKEMNAQNVGRVRK